MSRALKAVALVLLIVGLGCTSDDPTNDPTFFPLVYTDFTAATPLEVPTAGTAVFRDGASWTTFWQANTPLGTPVPPNDFNDEMLIAVFWGAGRTGCDQFIDAIDRVRVRIDNVNTLGVIEVEIGLLPNLGNCNVPLQPLQVIAVDATSTMVDFVGFLP